MTAPTITHPYKERLVVSVADFLKGVTLQEINAVLVFAIQLKIGGVQPAFFKLMAASFENLSQPQHTEHSGVSGNLEIVFPAHPNQSDKRDFNHASRKRRNDALWTVPPKHCALLAGPSGPPCRC